MVLKKLPLIELEGSNFEMGRQYGQQAAEQIKIYSKVLLLQAQKKTPGVTKEQCKSFAKRMIPYIKDFAPHLVDEMNGIAEGAGIPPEEVYFLNARSEMYFRNIPVECTSFGLLGSETTDGEVMLGQNADTVAGNEKTLVMLRLTPTKGPRILMYARAGTIAHIGINSYGLGRVGNGLRGKDYRELGVPKVIVDRVGIEQKSIDDVLTIIRNAKRTMSNNYIYADSTGTVKDIEVTAYEDRTLEPTHGFIAHANNYEHPDLIKYDLTPKGSNSHIRAERMTELIANETRPISEKAVKNWMRDHTAPICRHSAEDAGDLGGKTVASIISRPSNRLMHVCWGNPCEGKYYTYKL